MCLSGLCSRALVNQANISFSKSLLSACMKLKSLALDERMKVIEHVSKNPELGCRVIATHFNTGKTIVSNIVKNAKTLQKEYEFFKGSCEK